MIDALAHDAFSEPIENPESGRKTVIRKRARQIIVRLNDSERARLENHCRQTSLSTMGLIRKWINDEYVVSTVDIQAVAELRRQGGLLKIIAYNLLNAGLADRSSVGVLLSLGEEIHTMAKEIRNGAQKNTEID